MAIILAIDDDASLRRTIVRMLTVAGHDVLDANNSTQAMARHGAAPIDLVITDILMPEKDGIELIRELRQAPSAVRIIAISGGGERASESYLTFAGSFGANAVLPKPFRAAELLALVERVLESDRDQIESFDRVTILGLKCSRLEREIAGHRLR